jgi:Domain of unknown function (DUF4129)
MSSKIDPTATESLRTFRFMSYGLVFLMQVCLVMTIDGLIQSAVPEWPSGIIIGIMLFIAMDRLYTYRWFKPLQLFSPEWLKTIGAQWMVIIVFIRLLLSYIKGTDAFINEILLFARGHLENFLSPEFVVTLLLAIFAWYLVGQFLGLLDEIGLDQALTSHENEAILPSETVPAQRRLVNLVFSTGISLVILAAITRVDWHAVFSDTAVSIGTDANQFSQAEAGTLFYFIFGLVLLSQSRLMSLRTRWNLENIPIASNDLATHWGKYSLLFILILATLVSLLPTGGSHGFFALLATLIGFLIGAFVFIGQLIVMLILILGSLPFLLLGKGLPPLYRVPNPLPSPIALAASPVTTTDNTIWILVKSILLWGSLLLLIGFSLTHFLKQRKGLLAMLRKLPLANWMVLAWQWLRTNLDKTQSGLSRAITDGWQNIASRLEGRRSLPRLGLISLGFLDPRRQIYFFYLAMVRRGNEQGLARKPSQTPSEYAVTLEKGLPSSSEDIDTITEAFVAARYSRHEVTSGAAKLVKATWNRIRRALRKKSSSK